MIHVTKISSNVKLGPITATRTKSETCPPTCGLFSSGECYDLQGNTAIHRRRVDNETYDLLTFSKFLDKMAGFTRIFRWGVGGDLPNHMHNPERIDSHFLSMLLDRVHSLSMRMIAFTHKPVRAGTRGATREDASHNRRALRKALNRAPSVTVNVSCESNAELDQAMAMGFDCVVTQPIDSPNTYRTPAGNRVVKCLALQQDHTTCSSCGNGNPLCSRRDRGYAIGFDAHGTRKGALSDRIIQANS